MTTAMIQPFWQEETGNVSSGSVIVQKVCVLYLILWTVAPILSIDTIWRILALLAFGVWYSLAKQRGYEANEAVKKAIACAVFFILIAFLETFKAKSILRRIDIIMLAISICLFNFYLNHPFELSEIIPFVLLALTFFNYKSAHALGIDSHVARYIVRNSEIAHSLLRQGVGGYGLIYLQVCSLPSILLWGKKVLFVTRNKLLIAIGSCWFVSFILFLFRASYSIALFSTALSFFFLIPRKNTSWVKSAIVMLVLFASLLAAIAYIEPFRAFLFDVFEGTTVEKKLHDFSVMNGLETNDRFSVANDENPFNDELEERNYGSIDVRMRRYGASLFLLLKYPIVGALIFEGPGGHSAILDTFAKFGWLGGWLYCCMIFAVPWSLKKYVSNVPELQTHLNAVFVVILFVGLLDSFPFEISFNLVTLNALFTFEVMKIIHLHENQDNLHLETVAAAS